MSHGFERVGVIGAGQMGHGIAQIVAGIGLPVLLQDVSESALERGKASVAKSLGKFVSKGKMTEEARTQALELIETTADFGKLAGSCDVIIEAATEDAELKFKIFGELDRLAHKDAILLTNTSSVSITHIAGHTNRPGQVMGMHFMNPVPLMKLVELIRGLVTDETTFERCEAFAHALGKETVRAEDFPGFIVNRILVPMINEACYALMERVGDVQDIDTAMRLGANHPMGPLQLADLIGLDTCLSIMEVLHTDMGDAKYRPCPLLHRYVRAGFLGRKSGRGFYEYDPR